MVGAWLPNGGGLPPPNPPGMSAANQAASVVIDVSARTQGRNPMSSHFRRGIDQFWIICDADCRGKDPIWIICDADCREKDQCLIICGADCRGKVPFWIICDADCRGKVPI